MEHGTATRHKRFEVTVHAMVEPNSTTDKDTIDANLTSSSLKQLQANTRRKQEILTCIWVFFPTTPPRQASA
eukprot:1405054-Amphidinium_carterae.1